MFQRDHPAGSMELQNLGAESFKKQMWKHTIVACSSFQSEYSGLLG